MNLTNGLFVKEPQDSELGRNIVKHAILLIDGLGFESFTFKKLAKEIGSTEASIYRYFENKHMLLLYLVSWYWEWVGYLIEINTKNIEDPRIKLKTIIYSFVSASLENPSMDFVNESILHDVVIAEGTKAYHTKEVDKENAKGFFASYKNLAQMVSAVITDIDPSFKYPFALATNLFEMSNNQIYFAKHLPRLTDVSLDDDKFKEVEEMLAYFVDRLLSGESK
jgi:AcrR family transcriptional regulator